MLRSLVAERGKVREAMGWCITRSQYAADIVETVTEALTISATPPPKKIARLYLVSDLLHNSSASVPNASSYRTAFEATLPTIFASVHSCRASLDSRMAQQTFGEQAAKLLRVWGAWSLFPPSYIARLERVLAHGTAEAPPAAPPAAAADDDGPDTDSDVDGEPMVDERAPPPPAPTATSSSSSSSAAAAREARVRSLTLRELEAVCEANSLSSSGSRAEMLERLLLALASSGGASLNLDAAPTEQQTLAIATRWDNDDDADAPRAAAATSTAPAPAAAAAADIDGEDIDGEDIDGAPIAQVPPPAAHRRARARAAPLPPKDGTSTVVCKVVWPLPVAG